MAFREERPFEIKSGKTARRQTGIAVIAWLARGKKLSPRPAFTFV
jgi:hypothetical protein